MKRIVLICAGGMSTSVLMRKMKDAAEKFDIEVEIVAISESRFREFENKTDILILGPQIGFMLDDYKGKYGDKISRIFVVDSVDYGMMNGEKVLKQALGL